MLWIYSKLFLYSFVFFMIGSLASVCVQGDYLQYPEYGHDCTTPSSDRGICKHLKNCKQLLELLVKNKSNANSPAIELLRRSHCGFDGLYPIVCCPQEKGKPKENTEQTLVHFSSQNVFNDRFCGLVQATNKVTGGTTTVPHEFPWMALIGYKTSQGLQYRCGGSLVSSRYVLTAAHCVSSLTDISPISVRLGEYDLRMKRDCNNRSGCSSPLEVSIEKIIPHPKYYKSELQNDIALIRLTKKVKFSNSIRPICLPTNQNAKNMPSIKAVVTGWGTTELGIKSYILLKASLPIISPAECSRIYRQKAFIDETSQICAGGEAGKDSCSGDSGGPLQVVGLNSAGHAAYIQLGIVSFGPRNCGTEGVPGVYTKVSHYMDWIQKNVEE